MDSNGGNNSEGKNYAPGSVESNAIAGTFKHESKNFTVFSVLQHRRQQYNMNFSIMYIYLTLLSFFAVALLMFPKSIACNHSGLYYVASEVPAVAMHQDVAYSFELVP